MKHRCIIGMAGLLVFGTARGQYDTLFVGQFEALSNGPFETPFPTGGAMTSRTQYLFHASELSGLLPNQDLQGIVIDVLDDDAPGTTVDLYLQMKNTVTASMGDFEYSGLQFVAESPGPHLDQGTLAILFNVAPFQWNGAHNVVVEFGMNRYGPPGVDPRVKLDTSFLFTPTFYAHDTVFVPPASLTSLSPFAGPFGSRPVMGFLMPALGTGLDQQVSAIQVALYPNPAADHLTLRVLDAPSGMSVQLFSSTGALARTIPLTATDPDASFDLPLSGLASGCYLLKVNDEAGHLLWAQRLSVE